MLLFIHILLWFTALVVALTKYRFPQLLTEVTAEDGPVEWATFLCLIGLAFFLLYRLGRGRFQASKKVKFATAGLAFLCLLAAGEEISWGQRLLGLETGETFRKFNYQDELNLHNLMHPQLFNGIIIVTFFLLFCFYPLYKHLRSSEPAWWVPSQQLTILSLGAILVNHYRVSRVEQWGNLLVALLIFGIALIALKQKRWAELTACLSSLLTSSTLFWCRHVLKINNMQYEIRELLVILIVAQHCREAFNRLTQQVSTRPLAGSLHIEEAKDSGGEI